MNDSFLVEPPEGLCKKIIDRIHKEQRLLILRRTLLFSALTVFSIVSFAPAYAMLSSEASNTGFSNLSSFIFSDSSAVLAYWNSFSLALLETLPAVSLSLFLFVLIVFLHSLNSLIKNIRILTRVRLADAN